MLSCDLAKFADESQRMMSDGADWLHLDIMVPHAPHTATQRMKDTHGWIGWRVEQAMDSFSLCVPLPLLL